MSHQIKPAPFYPVCGPSVRALEVKNSICAKGELLLYGVIGDWWDGLDSLSIVQQLNALPGAEITVRINTPGGSVIEGLAMFNNLKQSPKKVNVYIDGIAASMGSVIAMAGDNIYIPSNALFMLHKPGAEVGGNANDLREYANNLDTYEGSLLQIYSDRTGKTVEEIRTLLADGKDHYFRGQDAIDYGLADHLIDGVAVKAEAKFFASLKIPDAFSSQLFVTNAAAAAQTIEDIGNMKIKIKAKAGGWHIVPGITAALENTYSDTGAAIAALAARGVTVTSAHLSGDLEVDTELLNAVAVALGIQAAPVQAAGAQPIDPNAAAIAAVTAERTRQKELRELGATARADEATINGWIDSGMAVVDARTRALEIIAKRDKEGAPGGHVRVGSSVPRAQLRTAMATALLNTVRPGQFELDDASGQFRGQGVMAMIGTALQFAGESIVGKNSNDLVAMAMHTTSDFPLILQDAANRVLRQAYELQPRTFTNIAARTSANDFRSKRSLQIGGGSGLDKVNESGEFKLGTVSESGESYKLETFGKIFAFTRQLMINDDMAALVRFFNQIGNLASRKESDIVWGLVKANPVLSDGVGVYSTDAKRKNLISGANIDETTMKGMKKAHRQMVGLDGETISIAPKFLVVNSEREVEAQKMLEIIQATQTSGVNVFARSMDLIVESRLDGVANNPFYTFADPNAVPTLEYAYLSGNEGPTISTEWGFETDGMKLKVVHDFGAGFVDFRGTAKGAGA